LICALAAPDTTIMSTAAIIFMNVPQCIHAFLATRGRAGT
jgi:hypothetical protein